MRHYNNVVASPEDLALMLFEVDLNIDDFDHFSQSVRCRSRKNPECIWQAVCQVALGDIVCQTMNKYVRKYYDLFYRRSDAVKAEYVRLRLSALVVPKLEKQEDETPSPNTRVKTEPEWIKAENESMVDDFADNVTATQE